jgi:zinc protease
MPELDRRSLIAGLPAAAALAAAPRAVAAIQSGRPVFGAETFTLENGLTGVVIPMRRAPVAAHMVWYRVGAADEPPGLSGMAHFLEHLMFKGTPNVGPGEFSRRVAREGGRDNAFTGHDYTGYFQQVAVDRLELVMRMEADRMANLLLDPKDIEPERLVILEERRQVVETIPTRRFRERLAALLYLNHPYGRPVIGWEHEIRTIPRAALVAFHERYYGPGNAILVVQGDVSLDQVRRLAEATYGQVPKSDRVARLRPQEPPPAGDRRLALRDPRVREPQMARLHLAPTARAAEGEADALEVLAHVLGSGPTSRLWRALVDTGLAAAASASYGGESVDPTEFALYASPRPGTDPARAEAALGEVVARLLDEGVTEDEVARAIRQMTAGAAFARDSLMGGARTIGASLAVDLPLEHVEHWPSRIAGVTPARVTEAARAVLRAGAGVTGWLMPGERPS